MSSNNYLILELTPEQAQALLDYLIESDYPASDEILDIKDDLEYLCSEIEPLDFDKE